ncbi:Ger(x)C family spore germination protein [Neobacillus sp. 19]|uniref:Ger(x)C family spore germination protein n=2 Tax=Bacillaceae TaxID=186817 RepID=UPI001188ED5B|nr:Ger(x)C family spore germination protein [Bacillus sp. S3]
MMRKVVVRSFMFVLLLPILSACWNQKELTDLAFVMAIGVDKGEEKKFNVSFQIVNPGNVSSGQNGGGQGLPIAVYKSSGDTLTEAARNATKQISRRLYYSHTNLIAVSEDIAKDGLLYIMDALDRDPEFRTTTQLVVTRDTSAEVLVASLANLDKMPVNKITKEIKATEAMLGENTSINIDDFLAGLVSDGKEPIVNGFKLTGNDKMAGELKDLQHTRADSVLKADGLAVFREGKLVGWIDNNNARGVIWILDRLKSTGVNVTWKGKKSAITVSPIRSKTRVSVKILKGNPVIYIAIENEGWVSEANTDIDLTDPNEILKVEKLTGQEIKREVLSSVKKAQKMKSDIFGFGERLHRKNPTLWNQLKPNWNDHFAELEVHVKVDSYIRREGIRTKPFWSDLNN